MRNLNTNPVPKTSAEPFPKKRESKTITCFLDQFLLTKCRNLIKSRQLGGDYQYNTISDLIRESLLLHQRKELTLKGERNLTNPRQNTSFILPLDLTEYYYS